MTNKCHCIIISFYGNKKNFACCAVVMKYRNLHKKTIPQYPSVVIKYWFSFTYDMFGVLREVRERDGVKGMLWYKRGQGAWLWEGCKIFCLFNFYGNLQCSDHKSLQILLFVYDFQCNLFLIFNDLFWVHKFYPSFRSMLSLFLTIISRKETASWQYRLLDSQW